ncbi:MAG: hypothetical protein R2822_01180 [Spirosomataceae bacterium]
MQIWLIGHAAEDSIKTDFDLRHKNQLLLLFSGNSQGFIGQYNGREEGLYNLTNTQHGIFVFVIEGVFEVQNRLLHARDGLSLQNVASIDFEALSNEAILVLLETPLQSQPA